MKSTRAATAVLNLVAILTAGMASAQVLDGQAMTFDNVKFTPPAGWVVERTAAGIDLRPTDIQGPEALQVTIMTGRPSNAGLEREFEATWSEILSSVGAEPMRQVSGGPYDLDEPGRSLRGWDYLRGYGGMRVGGRTFSLALYIIRAGDRVERVAVLAVGFSDNLTETDASRNPRYVRAIQQLVFTLQFENMPPVAIPRATMGTGGIVGVWAGLGMSFGRIKPEIAAFFDDGTAYFAPTFPLRGLLDIDPSVEQSRARRYWGSYTFRNGSGVLSLPYGDVPLRSDGAGLLLTTNATDHRYTRLRLPGGPELQGTWCMAEECIRFMEGGRFADDGAIRTVAHEIYPFPESPPRGTGQYEVSEHTLVLRYDAGPELWVPLPGFIDDSTGPRDLLLGWNLDWLVRR